MTEAPTNGPSVPALEKGIDVLEFLAVQKNPVSLQEISTGLHRSRGELYRMVAWLTEQQYVVRSDGTEKYVLGERIGQLFKRQVSMQDVVSMALPTMTAISAATLATCHLSIRAKSSAVVLNSTQSSEYYDLSVEHGTLVPLWKCPAGACMVEDLSAGEIEEISTTIDPQWRELFAEERGHASTHGYVVRHGIAAPSVFEFAFSHRTGGRLSTAITAAKLANSDAEVEALCSELKMMLITKFEA